MKMLLFNPILTRLHSPGAAELDTFALARTLVRLRHDVVLFQPCAPTQPPDDVRAFCAAYLPQHVVIETPMLDVPRIHMRRLSDPARIDGAGWRYASPPFERLLSAAIQRVQPDALIAMMSFGWGAVTIARRHGVKTALRSQNNEARHLLQESGVTVANLIRYIGKAAVERRVARLPDVVIPITPDEERFYRRLAPRATIHLLPLLTLPDLIRAPRPQPEKTRLHVFFMGSSYNVPHNRSALQFVVEQVVPAARECFPAAFVFHVLGSKAPPALAAHAAPDLIFEGYVADLDGFLDDMDIALVPSLAGAGMQQKAFEPLCRAFPVITHERVLAGYRFVPGRDVLTGVTAADFVSALGELRDPSRRAALSHAAHQQARRQFSPDVIDSSMQQVVLALASSTGANAVQLQNTL
jgi:hypothetical protein